MVGEMNDVDLDLRVSEDFQGHDQFQTWYLERPQGWAYLPDILLEEIFSMLTYKERHICSQVCRMWYQTFYSPRIWKSLIVKPRTFTYKRINRFTGEEHEVSKYKVYMCLQRIGHYFRRISIQPNSNFHNMSKVIQIIGNFLDKFDEEFPLYSLERFDFEFACESKDLWSHDFVIIGTGGGMLREMKYILSHLKNISHLSFNNLCLSNQDAVGFLDDFVINNRETLRYLEILNCTRHRHPLYNAGFFPHLTTFVTSPLHVNDSVVLLLAEKSQLKRLVLVQDRYTGACEPVSAQAWYEVKLIAPHLKVRLEVNGRTNEDILTQPMAPVTEIMYSSPNSQISTHTIVQIIDEYKPHLQVYGHKYIHRKYRARHFHDRADSALVLLIRECPNIHTLVVSERISTATILLVVSEAKALQRFCVRRNAVILKSDWPKAVRWSDRFYTWLHNTALDYDKVEKEVSKVLRQDWKMLSDKEFKQLKKL